MGSLAVAAAAQALASRWAQAQARARALGEPVLLSVTIASANLDPMEAFARLAAYGDSLPSAGDRPPPGWEVALWARPSAGLMLVGLGTAVALTAGGPARFARMSARWHRLAGTALCDSAPDAAPLGPIGFGGFAFADRLGGGEPGPWDGFPPSMIAVPRLLLWSSGGTARAVYSALARPDAPDPGEIPQDFQRFAVGQHGDVDGYLAGGQAGAAPLSALPGIQVEEDDPGAWLEAVAETARAIRSGRLAKAVLARRVTVRAPRGFDVGRLLATLWQAYPQCWLFAFRTAGKWFVGATPERLVRVENGRVDSACLAGSAPRGSTAEEDRELEQALRTSPKERAEHALVLHAIREGLGRVCRHVRSPAEPTVWKLPTVQHLYTPLSGDLRPGVGVLEAVGQLHPTPAVGGVPRDAALEWIGRCERHPRGWYTGPVGWVGRRGDGEFAVAIRCAVLEGDRAVLWAGCGIMGESDPQEEYRESWLKLRPMLAALQAAAEAA